MNAAAPNLTDAMADALAALARGNYSSAGIGTFRALERRGLVTANTSSAPAAHGWRMLYMPTVEGWIAARELFGIERPADAGRATVEEAMELAYPHGEQVTAADAWMAAKLAQDREHREAGRLTVEQALAEAYPAKELPAGTRVTTTVGKYAGRTGTVNGVDVGQVTIPGHENFGRRYVGVNWDAIDGDMGSNRRSRPFIDELTVVEPDAGRLSLNEALEYADQMRRDTTCVGLPNWPAQAITFEPGDRVVCGDGRTRTVIGMTHRRNEPARVVVEGGAEWIADDCRPTAEFRCEGHYDDDYTLISGAGIGELAYCEGSCVAPAVGDAGTAHGAYEYMSGQ